jgi:hypothetical protein
MRPFTVFSFIPAILFSKQAGRPDCMINYVANRRVASTTLVEVVADCVLGNASGVPANKKIDA